MGTKRGLRLTDTRDTVQYFRCRACAKTYRNWGSAVNHAERKHGDRRLIKACIDFPRN